MIYILKLKKNYPKIRNLINNKDVATIDIPKKDLNFPIPSLLDWRPEAKVANTESIDRIK